MFKCWKCSSSDPELVGFIIFVALFWSLTYFQEGHLGILGYLQGKCSGYL